MDLKNSLEIPAYDERVAEIMLSVALDRPSNPAERGGKRVTEKPDYLSQKIPTTVDEFMEMEGLSDWPEHITSEYPIEHDSKSVFGDLEDIKDYLRHAAPLEEQLSALEALEKRLAGLEGSLSIYADAILTDETRFSRIKEGVFYSNIDKIPLNERPEQEKPTGGARQVAVAGKLQEKKKRDVNFTNFPGFRAKELTELPGQLEAPQLLHRITKAQDFNSEPDPAGFAKFWKKIFLSEASIAVVHDLFWWMFMKIFKPNTQIDQDMVFDRLSDSFAALFFSIHPDTRDKIFKVYPGVLAQAIFMIFHDAFAESHRMFGPMFKEELVGYCWELTTGTRPPPGTWRGWNLEALQGRSSDSESGGNKLAIANNIDGALDAPKYDFDALYRSIDVLETEVVNGEIRQVEPPEEVKQKVQEKKKVEEKESDTKIQSSFMGPGPEFEKAVFNLAGLSPLIAHFLNMKHLREINPAGRKVRRTEIRGQPSADKTFRDVIDEKKALTKANKTQYAKLCRETADELNRIERRKGMVTKEINKLKNNLQAFKQTGQDVKFLTDRLLQKMDEETRRVGPQMITNAGEISLERDSESDITDDELEHRIEQEVHSNPEEYGGGTVGLGGERRDVRTYVKVPGQAEERRQLKEQQMVIKYHFKETRDQLKAVSIPDSLSRYSSDYSTNAD